MRSALLRLFVAVLTGAGGGLVADAAGPSPAAARHGWHGYHWAATQHPVNLRPVNSLSPGFRRQGVAADVTRDWNRSSRFANVQRHRNNDARTRRSCPYPSGSFRMCDYNWGATGWMGMAQVRIRKSHIVEGRARVNNYYSTYWGDRRHVLCQEVGHLLGLHHQADGNHSCMDDSARGWDEMRPNAHDYEQLKRVYDHRHSGDRQTGWLTRMRIESHGATGDTTVQIQVRRLPGGDQLVSYILRPLSG